MEDEWRPPLSLENFLRAFRKKCNVLSFFVVAVVIVVVIVV